MKVPLAVFFIVNAICIAVSETEVGIINGGAISMISQKDHFYCNRSCKIYTVPIAVSSPESLTVNV